MSWYVGRSLDTLLAEVNASAPSRSKASDGSIGDTAHSSRDSDHNPCACHSAVCARDYTHDPGHGFDAHAFAEWLRARCQAGTEGRVSYIISNSRIASQTYGFKWNPYDGSNPHTKHVHVSVDHPESSFDSTASWGWSGDAGSATEEDDWMAEPADVWAVEWGRSGESAMTFVDTLDNRAADLTWTRKPWSSSDPPTTAVALQRIYEWCQQIQADVDEIKRMLT